VILLAGSGAVQFASSATTALVATLVLGAAQRGVMALGTSIGAVVSLLGGMGAGTVLRSRLPACADPAGRGALVRAYTRWSAIGVVLAAAAAAAVCAVSAPLVGAELSAGPFLAAVAAYTATQVLLLQTTEAWFADGQFRRGGKAAAAINVGGLAGLLAAAAFADSAAALLLAQAGGAAIGCACQLGPLRAANLLCAGAVARRDVTRLLTAGFPTLGLSVGLAVALRADRYVLGAAAGTAAVGVYSLAATLIEIPRLVPHAVGQLFMRDAALGADRARLSRSLLLSTVSAAIGAVLVVLCGWMLVVPVFGAEFAAVPGLLVILAVAEVCYAPFSIANRGLLGGGWTRTAGALGVAGSAGALVIYVVTANAAGSAGVAVGSVLVYAGLSLGAWHLLRRHLARRRPAEMSHGGWA